MRKRGGKSHRSYRGAYYRLQQGSARILANADGALYYSIEVW
jgi:hypothetical protein